VSGSSRPVSDCWTPSAPGVWCVAWFDAEGNARIDVPAQRYAIGVVERGFDGGGGMRLAGRPADYGVDAGSTLEFGRVRPELHEPLGHD
jgi:hypothetical protein